MIGNKNRSEMPTVESARKQRKRKKNSRRTLFLASAVVAVGVGAYFGTKKPLDQLVKSVQGSQKALDTLVEYTHYLEHQRHHQRHIIDAALDRKIDFTYYPGIGVHSFDMDKIKSTAEKAVKKSKKLAK